MRMAIELHNEWMVLMVFRHGANAIRREKLAFVEHVGEHAAQLIGANETEDQSLVSAGRDHWSDAFDQVGPMFDEPLAATIECRMLVARIAVDDGRTKQGHKADHCAAADRNCFAVGCGEMVVEETILLMPQRFFPI